VLVLKRLRSIFSSQERPIRLRKDVPNLNSTALHSLIKTSEALDFLSLGHGHFRRIPLSATIFRRTHDGYDNVIYIYI